MIIEFSDFKIEGKIPNLFPEIGGDDPVNIAIQENVQDFIDEYEHEYLIQFFGNEESVEFLEAYNLLDESEKTDEAYNKLIKSLKTIIPYYVAFRWFNNETIQNTGIGAVIPKGQNSDRTNNEDRSNFIWNKMARKGKELFRRHFNMIPPDIGIFDDTKNNFGI